MDRVNIHGKMALITKVNGKTTKSMVLVSMSVQMEENIKDNGLIIKSINRDSTDLTADVVVKETIMVKKLVLELSSGQMEI